MFFMEKTHARNVFIYTYICMNICTRSYIYTHIEHRIHTHIHTHNILSKWRSKSEWARNNIHAESLVNNRNREISGWGIIFFTSLSLGLAFITSSHLNSIINLQGKCSPHLVTKEMRIVKGSCSAFKSRFVAAVLKLDYGKKNNPS